MDSIIKGWPFGTLLLWKLVGANDLQRFPNRGFYRIIDRLEKYPQKDYDKANQITPKSPSLEYHMVLDGQQRLQSLILAVGGQDKWGFKLRNSDWHKYLGKKETSDSAHWSLGVLCINIEALVTEYKLVNNQLRNVDFAKVLCWGVLDSLEDVDKKDFSPLPFVQNSSNKGKYVKFSRIWNAIDANAPYRLKDIQKNISDSLFADWGIVDPIFKETLIEPIAELIETIRDIKNQEVYYLQISPYSTAWSQQEYNEAIVTVFTRLNTAGRALKHEEITMAWLKVGWNTSYTEDMTAVECFECLRSSIEPIWTAENEEEVRLISYIWAIFYHKGTLIDSKELLDGQIMQPMAGQISQDWKPLLESIKEGASLIDDRKLKDVFSSFNALIVALTVFYLPYRWKNLHSSIWSSQKDKDKENFHKGIETIFNPFVDRWILCSHWSGTWASSSGTDFQKFATDIATFWGNMAKLSSAEDFIKSFALLCNKLLSHVLPEAEKYVRTLVASRNSVSQYRSILWLWHRLNNDRLSKSLIQMRIKLSGKGRATSMKMEVDHTISYAEWNDLVEAEVKQQVAAGVSAPVGELEPPPKGFSAKIEEINYINNIGNCSLLQTNFNRSKNRGTLWRFMKDVDDFKSGKVKREDWESALLMSKVLTEMQKDDGTPATCSDIMTAIKKRTENIHNEVVTFINDNKKNRFGVADHTSVS